MSDFDRWIGEELERIAAQHLHRSLRRVDSAQGAEVVVDGSRLVNFSSNDYLGLANDPRLRAAGAAAIEQFGVGSGSARLICGNLAPHAELEEALARFKGTEAALTFASGFAAALGTLPALVGKGDVVILDKLSHACLVDAARLSEATIRVFPHNHLDKLERLLAWARGTHPAARVLVVTESVFSMDGDRAPLREIVELKDRFGAWLFLDEAHAAGVIGPNGRGLAAELGVTDRVDVQMATLGKALGSSGGAICGSSKLIDFLVNRARSFIFSTAPPPSAAAAAREALRLLESGEMETTRQTLWQNVRSLASGLRQPEPQSAILPLPTGDEERTLAAARHLADQGFWVGAIRPPTVPRFQARLRVVATSVHSNAQIVDVLAVLNDAQNEYNFSFTE